MKNVLLPRNVHLLDELARGRALLAFDFDGTLAPIVSGRDAAAMRAQTCALFREVCALFPTAVISGRQRGDVAARLQGAKVKYVVGNHGMESGHNSAGLKALLDEARERLGELVANTQGLELEDKGFSLTVHYRRAKKKLAAKRSIARVISELKRPMRSVGGKSVINVLPEGSRDKGHALLELREQARAEMALFVGDDVTDEDVFVLNEPRVLSIRVGRSPKSAADYFVRNQHEIDGLLRRLIASRSRQGAP